ncbi:MAG: class I SAM-dependent methyltransferase, partial [Verrucomicrobiota bacterium]
PPEFHGNPVDPDGSLVTMDWGYDILQYIQDVSGLASQIVMIDDIDRGIRAEFIEVIVSRKT